MLTASRVGRLVISLDVELAWGWLHDQSRPGSLEYASKSRALVKALLDLLEAHESPATWAFIFGLLDRRWKEVATEIFPDVAGLLSNAPAGLEELLYAPGLAEAVLSAPIGHEIACHSYAHKSFDAMVSPETARKDIDAACSVAADWGLQARSFVFPRNDIRYLTLLAERGFEVFRSVPRPPNSVDGSGRRSLYAVLPWVLTSGCAPIAEPTLHSSGLVEAPGSLLFRAPPSTWRRWIPLPFLVRITQNALERVANERSGTVHLWFHAFNFAHRTDDHLAALEAVLLTAGSLRARGDLEIVTMGELGSAAASKPGGVREVLPGACV